MIRRAIPVATLVLLVGTCGIGAVRVKVGADILLERRLDLLRGKRVGLVTNQTGRVASGELLLDALIGRGIAVTALFGPEHGYRGGAEAGTTVADTVDTRTGTPVYSLYGSVRKPTPAMLAHLDVLVYDVQDVGVRFYTYLSTMSLCMEAAAEAGIEFVVLDRPNPLGGIHLEGPVLPDSLRSFVGYLPLPVIYGLTIGELATMARAEGWVAHSDRLQLTVIPMEGWTRTMEWDATGLPWFPPSPNIRWPETPYVYPATCYLEATNVSEGRGTSKPFHLLGAPFVKTPSELPEKLQRAGVRAEGATFTPASSKYRGRECQGALLFFQHGDSVSPLRVGLTILSVLMEHYADSLIVNRKQLARLLGDAEAYDLLLARKTPEFIQTRWRTGLDRFAAASRLYWRYPEK